MHSSQFGITFTDSRGPVNSDGPIHCIRSLNRMVRYSVMPLPAGPGKSKGELKNKTRAQELKRIIKNDEKREKKENEGPRCVSSPGQENKNKTKKNKKKKKQKPKA